MMMNIAHPPQYIANVVTTKTWRFCPTVTGAYTITAAKLCGLLSYASTTTAIHQVYESVRIHYIRVWGAAGSTTAVGSVSVTYFGQNLGSAGANSTISDTTVGATRVAAIHAPPPRDSQAAQWQSGQTNVGTVNLFEVNCPAGGVIDVHLSMKVSHNLRTVGTNNATLGIAGVVGQLYYLALDNAYGGTGSVGNTINPDPSLVTAA